MRFFRGRFFFRPKPRILNPNLIISRSPIGPKCPEYKLYTHLLHLSLIRRVFGEDLDPSIYGHFMSSTTYANVPYERLATELEHASAIPI